MGISPEEAFGMTSQAKVKTAAGVSPEEAFGSVQASKPEDSKTLSAVSDAFKTVKDSAFVQRSVAATREAAKVVKKDPTIAFDAAIDATFDAAKQMMNLSVSGVSALAKSMFTPVKVDPRLSISQQARQNFDQSINSFVSNQEKIKATLDGVNQAEPPQEEQAMSNFLNIIPDAVNSAGDTVYEKTGSALAGAGAQTLGTVLMMKPGAAAKVFGKIADVTREKAAPTRVSAAFDELAVKDAESAEKIAAHVEQVDSKTAQYMRKRIQKFVNASEEDLNFISKRAAEAAIAEMEGNYDEIIKSGTQGYQGPEGLKYDTNVKGKVGPAPEEPEIGLGTGEGKASKGRTKSRSGPSDYGKDLIERTPEAPVGLGTGEGRASPGKGSKPGPSDYGKEVKPAGLSTGEGKSSPTISASKASSTIRNTIREAQDAMDAEGLKTGEGRASPGRSKTRSAPSDYGKGLVEGGEELKDLDSPKELDRSGRQDMFTYDHFRSVDEKFGPSYATFAKEGTQLDGKQLLGWIKNNLPKLREVTPGVDSNAALHNDRIAMTHELLDTLKKRLAGVTVKFYEQPLDAIHPATGESMKAGGLYKPGDHTVHVYHSGAETTATILHELVHAATSDFIWANPEHPLVKRLDNLRKVAKQHNLKVGLRDHYGLSNAKEFAAEVMTNSQFQKFLSGVPLGNGKGTLYSKFVDLVKNILGLKSSRALEIAIRTTQDIIEEQHKSLPPSMREEADLPSKLKDDSVVYFNNGIPVTRSAIVRAFTFTSELADKTPGLRLAKAKMAQLYDSYIKTFNPEAMGPAARTAGSAIAQNFFKVAQKHLDVWEKGKERRVYWQQMGEEAGLNFIKQFESGKPFSNPLFENARRIYEAWGNRILQQDLKTGFMYNRVDHYMPHMFKDGEGIQRWMQQRYGNKWADPRFIKQRGFNLYQEAIDAGFTPKFKNPEELMQARQHASDIAEMRVDLLKDLERKGVARQAAKGDTRAPEGFHPETYRSPTGVRYWIRDEAVPLIKNALDSKSLWEKQGLGGDLFRAFMEAKNKLIPIKLAASLFHPMHVMHIDAAANLTRGIKSYAGGNMLDPRRAGKFIIDMATSMPFTPTGVAKNFFEAKGGYPLLQVFKGKRAFETLSEADKQAFHDLAESGMVPTRPLEETSNDIQKLKDAWYKKSLGSAAWHLPWALMQGLTLPIYSVWIPSLKIASVLKDMKVAREMNPNWTPRERQEAARQIARKVEARYGEMNYQSMFMNKIAKDIGVATNLSLGWNLGLLDQYAGGAIDLGKAGLKPGGLKEKLADGTLDRPIFAAMYIGTAMTVGGLMHYWFTGQAPQTLTDYTHPESGEKDKYGKPIRLNTMFYTREFEGLHKRIEQEGAYDAITDFIANKGSGIASMAYSSVSGLDGLGNRIRDENDPGYKQLVQTLSYELADMEPISIEALNRSTTNPEKMRVLGGLGFTAAGKYISESVTEGQIEANYNRYVRPKEKPYKGVQLGKDMNSLREMFNSDDAKYGDKLEEMAEKYDLDDKDIRRIERQFGSAKEQEFDPSVFMFSKLPWEVQKPLLDKMTPEERETYLMHISKQKRAKYERETQE